MENRLGSEKKPWRGIWNPILAIMHASDLQVVLWIRYILTKWSTFLSHHSHRCHASREVENCYSVYLSVFRDCRFRPVRRLIAFERALNSIQHMWIWQNSYVQRRRKLYFYIEKEQLMNMMISTYRESQSGSHYMYSSSCCDAIISTLFGLFLGTKN